jgi:hypothetical protein
MNNKIYKIKVHYSKYDMMYHITLTSYWFSIRVFGWHKDIWRHEYSQSASYFAAKRWVTSLQKAHNVPSERIIDFTKEIVA